MAAPTSAAVEEARSLTESLLRLRPQLKGPEVLDHLRDGLNSATPSWALHLLLFGDVDLVSGLMPEILESGFRHRDALLVREIFGRLPRTYLEVELLSAIAARDPYDDDEVRRVAELLTHLGLSEGLKGVLGRFSVSKDPDVLSAVEELRRAFPSDS